MSFVSIKEELLEKARRDTTKLVQVQRSVSRGGKTFMQNFWVKPSEVKSTDKVIGGQQNLLPSLGSVTKPASGVFDSTYFDALAASDRSKALDYLKSCGITWKENAHPGINWMHAKQALAAQGANFKGTQVNPQTKVQNASSAQNSQPKSTASLPAGMFDKLSSIKQEFDACKNGREKVVLLKKKLGQDGCMQFAEAYGVQWDKHQHVAINNMRMSMALQEYFDKKDGTVSPKKTKDTKPSSPKSNPDEIPVPKNATPRQQNIISILNNTTDTSELESFASIGMLPEDDVSKSFIIDKLVPKYAIFAAAHLKSSSSSTKKNRYNGNYASGFGDQVAFDLNYEGCAKKVVAKGLADLYDGFNMAMLTDPRSQLSTLVGSYSSRGYRMNTTFGVLTDLNDSFAYYVTDEYAQKDSDGLMVGQYLTNRGYTGSNPEEYKKRYDLEKEGFVRAIRTIQDKYPQLENKGNEMIGTYDEMMEICKGNPRLLEIVLSQDHWKSGNTDGKPKTWDFGSQNYGRYNIKPEDARETLRVLDLQYDTLMKFFADKGLNSGAIVKTLSDTWYNDNLSRFVLKDENGDTILRDIDVIHSVLDSSGIPVLNDSNSQRCSTRFLQYFKARYMKENNIDGYFDKQVVDDYEFYKQIANFTSEDYLKVQSKFYKMFGYEFTTTDLNTGVTKTIDLTSLPAEEFGRKLENSEAISTYDKDKDYILSNLSMMSLETRIHNRICGNLTDNPSSKLNNGGRDYSGNYSYYSPRGLDDSKYRVKTGSGWGSIDASKCYTADELSKKINEQLDSAVTYSPEYIDHLQAYYNAKSSYQDATGEAKKANMNSVGIDVADYTDNPLKDVLYNYTTQIAQNIPKMSERGADKLKDLMAKRMDYVPYDFKAVKQKKLSDIKPGASKSSATTKSQLRSLREAALKATHCSICVEDEATSLQMRKDFLKNWDYRDGHTEKTPDGFTKTGRMYSGSASWGGHDRRALFNSRFFRVNNSNMEEDYDAYRTELTGDTSLDASASEELELYHACSYAGAAGILGKTGGWFMGNQYTKTAKALGNGAYFGYKGAKSSVYCGEGSGGYHNTSASGAVDDNANGCYILATVMRGKSGDSQSDHGRFRDYEIAVKNNKCIKPHHFVDISARCMDVNVKRDSNGNYLDPTTGKITHDRYGKSVTMS